MVVTGGSAGGLSTFLHTDRVANALKKNAPNLKQIRGAPVVGFFLDHDNFKHTWNTYTEEMKYIYSMQNLTSGSGALNEECLETYYNNPHYCFMSPHMQKFIKTPFFMFNSKYDAWQIGNEIQISSMSNKKPWITILSSGLRVNIFQCFFLRLENKGRTKCYTTIWFGFYETGKNTYISHIFSFRNFW